MMISSPSPLSTAPNHTLTSFPSDTLPKTLAVSAIKTSLPLPTACLKISIVTMHSKHYLLTNIGELYGILDAGITVLKGADMSKINSIKNAYLEVEDGYIKDFGSMDECPNNQLETRNMNGKWVMPGFVDSHTHMVFAGPRHNEYVMRLKGKTYAEIAEEGGGILNSAKKLQAMSEDELFEQALAHLRNAIHSGTTAIEIKSGYGLNTESELKMLRVIKRLKAEVSIVVKSTF